MPPRTLPWLAAPKDKPYDPLSTDPLATSSPVPSSKRKRNATPLSDQDLVDPDLNPTGVSTPERRAKQRLISHDRSPSTSPPPAPPSVEYMRPGYGADDAWMMVEDEFFATAQLYTQHLHHAAYAEQKRRAQARGEKVLKVMGRPTDGRTERNGMLLEREERDKSIKAALGKNAEDEEGELTDPLLEALMNDPKRMGRALEGVGRVKSDSRAAKGFQRSPEKVRRTFMSSANGGGETVDYHESDDESDDLDAPVRKASVKVAIPDAVRKVPKPTKPSSSSYSSTAKSDPHRSTGLFKKFAAASTEESSNTHTKPAQTTTESSRNTFHRDQPTKGRRISVEITKNPSQDSVDDFEPLKPSAREGTSSYLEKRKQRKEEEEKRKLKEKKKAAVEVPTFLF